MLERTSYPSQKHHLNVNQVIDPHSLKRDAVKLWQNETMAPVHLHRFNREYAGIELQEQGYLALGLFLKLVLNAPSAQQQGQYRQQHTHPLRGQSPGQLDRGRPGPGSAR